MKHSEYSQEERLMAAIAHGCVIATGPGIIAAVLIWLMQQEKSRYAAGQALQAAVYQLLGMIVIVVLWVGYTVLWTIAMIPMMQNPEKYNNAPLPPWFWVAMAATLIPLAVMVVWWLYGLWGALKSWQGEDFRYFLIGQLLAKK